MVAILITLTTAGQDNNPCLSKGNPMLDKDKPSVYVEYRNSDQDKKEEPIPRLWLRLTNNSGSAINLITVGLKIDNYPDKIEQVRLCNGLISALPDQSHEWLVYWVDRKGVESNSPGPIFTAGDVWLPSGRTVIFPVLRKDLAVSSIKLLYSYESEWVWSDGKPKEHDLSTDHYVRFKLPKQ
jgi:hypothetical protein